ncbi:adenylyltransferase/cytidyltransferase family protein [Patescibacteria group bacterium]
MSKPKPIFSLEILYKMCYDLKKEGKKIGFTHGAFDLFHFSHLDLLKKSEAICDFLIVGIESDEHVETYKSYKRPIVDEKSRTSIIGELNCVDAVFVNDLPLNSQTYTYLYKELHVDCVTIGNEFQYEDIMQEQVLRAGSDLVKLNPVRLYSTTSLISSIIRKYTKNDLEDVPKSDY